MKMPLLLAALLLSAAPGFAQIIYGLGTITGSNFRNAATNSQGLITIDAADGSALNLYPAVITGTTAGQLLVGIDFRPADNLLYALGYDAATTDANTQLYVLDPAANAVARVGTPVRLELGSAADRIGVDFDPGADRLRVTSTNGANYRLNPADGSAVAPADGLLAYAGGAPAAPAVSAVAYTNSFAGSRATTPYTIDYRNGLLAVLSPAEAGTLTAQQAISAVITTGSSPATYGIGQPDALALDLYYDPTAKQTVGYLTEVTARNTSGYRSSNLYRLDLATGKATMLGNTVPASVLFNFEIRDVAVVLPQNVPLPVELVRFTAVAAGPGAVRLAWATASERNSAYFDVERSLDGARFGVVGQVPAAGDSFAARSYGLTDTALPEGATPLYYRLHQVDRDGRSAYSPVQTVALPEKAAAVGLFPNPAKAATTLVGAPAGATVQVLDALGRPVATATADATGRAELALPTGLAGGVYVVRVGGRALRLLVE